VTDGLEREIAHEASDDDSAQP